jgi:hypothetical protein
VLNADETGANHVADVAQDAGMLDGDLDHLATRLGGALERA